MMKLVSDLMIEISIFSLFLFTFILFCMRFDILIFRVNVGGKIMTNHLKEVLSYR